MAAVTMPHSSSFIEGTRGQPLLREIADADAWLQRWGDEGAGGALLYPENLPPGFFDLSSQVADQILARFRQAGVRLAVVRAPDTWLSRRFPRLVDEERRRPHFRVFEDRAAAREWLEAPDPRVPLRDLVRRAFADTPRPDNSRLRDSVEGEEPYLVEQAFSDKADWRTLDPEFIDRAPDGFASALSFFSREAFRYFLPAYLLADIDDRLDHAHTAFHLWFGLDDESATQKINPRRYGDMTWLDAKTDQFAVFTHEEAEAIVAYLEFKAAQDEFEEPKIRQALANYWYPRVRKD